MKIKIIIGIGMVVTENRLRKLGFKETTFLYDTKPKTVWVLGNHMTDSGSFADTITYDPTKNRISAQYGGNISIPTYQLVESTWDIKQFLKEHPYRDEKAEHEEKHGINQEKWRVILVSTGEYKINVMKELKDILGISLNQTREIVNNLPQKITTEMFKDSATVIKNQLEEIGAVVEIQ